jgi:hypothetical protein
MTGRLKMNRKKTLVLLGGSAALFALALTPLVGTSGQVDSVAGSGAGVAPTTNTYAQPTQSGMTIGVTVTAGPAPTTLATSFASPIVKATVRGAECNTTGMCP